MAVSFGNIQTIVDYGPSTTITNSITLVTGVRPVMIVAGNGHTASDAITSITWNGVALTKVQVQAPTGSNDRYIYIFVLVNPDSGTHNLVINNSTSAYFFGYVAVYNGCAEVQPGTSGKSTSTAATTFTETLTIANSGSWIVGWAHHWNGNLAAGVGTTLRTAAAVTGLGDSNGPVNVGSSSIQFTGSSETWMGVYLSLLPIEQIKKINGVYMGSQEIASTRFVDANAKIYYRFEDNVTDTTGNYNGTATDISYVTGKFGKGASFNGTSSKVVTNYATNLTTFSFSMWINFDASATGGNTILSKAGQNAANTDDFPVIIRAWDRNIYFNLAAPGDYTADYSYQSGALSTGTWYHIAMVYVGASYVKTFINGVEVNSATIAWSIGTNTRNWTLGAMTNNGAGEYNFDGIIDDFLLTDDALTSDEIYSLYKTGVKKLNGVVNLNPELESTSLRGDANLVGYWKFEGNSTDETANNNDGTDTGITYGTAYGKMGQGAVTNTNPSGILIPATAWGTIGTGDFAISLWIKPNAPAAGCYPALFVSSKTASPFQGPTAFFDPLNVNGLGNCIIFRVTGSNNVVISSPSASSLYGIWTHIVFTRASGVCYVYYNNTQVKSFADTTNIGAADYFYILSRANSAAQSFSGGANTCSGDDFAIFSRALTAQEISNLYNTNIKKYNQISNV